MIRIFCSGPDGFAIFLGGSARRIYLVGNLRLENATRKYLEAHNIAPIDLSPLVKHRGRKDQHSAATRIFLHEMRKAKPPPANEWKRIQRTAFPIFKEKADNYPRIFKDHALAADILEKTIPLLKADRENYPGWLICPVRHRHLLRPYRVNWLLRKPVLDLLNPRLRAEALFELLWCCETGAPAARRAVDRGHDGNARILVA
jgi:hypothetical protein